MPLLYDRWWRVQVGDLEIGTPDDGKPAHAVRFAIEKTTRLEANTAEVRIANLGHGSRGRAAAVAPLVLAPELRQLRIEAGYFDKELRGLLFSGDVVRVESSHPGADWWTTIRAGDGEVASRTAVTVASFGPGTKLSDVVKRLAADLGVNGKQAVERFRQGDVEGALGVFRRGLASAEHSVDQLKRLEEMTGLAISIQDGKLLALGPGEATADPPVVLAEDSGLVESPRRIEGGAVIARALLNPGIQPGRRIILESNETKGTFVVQRVRIEGDSAGGAWTTEVEMVEHNGAGWSREAPPFWAYA